MIVGREAGCPDGQERCHFFDSQSGWAFGPAFESVEEAYEFESYLGEDPREVGLLTLGEKYKAWLAEVWLPRQCEYGGPPHVLHKAEPESVN